MKLIYADESGNTGIDLENTNQPIFVLGTVSLEHTNWHKINDYFNTRKVEIFEIPDRKQIKSNHDPGGDLGFFTVSPVFEPKNQPVSGVVQYYG